MRTRGQVHIYYTSKKPEVDYRCLGDSIVSLTLLFGIITYLFIIFFLTFWLTKYHRCQCHVTDSKDHLDDQEEYFRSEAISPETKVFQNTPSGKQSQVKDDQGVFKQSNESR
jgi:hypothetical protein